MSSHGVTGVAGVIEYPISFKQIQNYSPVEGCWDYKQLRTFWGSLSMLQTGDAPYIDHKSRKVFKDQSAVSSNFLVKGVSLVERAFFKAFNPNYLVSALQEMYKQRIALHESKKKNQELSELFGLELFLQQGVHNLTSLLKYYEKKDTSHTISTIQQTALDILKKYPLFANFMYWEYDSLFETLRLLRDWKSGCIAKFQRQDPFDDKSGRFIYMMLENRKVEKKKDNLHEKLIGFDKEDLFFIEALQSIVNIFKYLKVLDKKQSDVPKIQAYQRDWKKFQNYQKPLENFILGQIKLRENDQYPAVAKALNRLLVSLKSNDEKIDNVKNLLEECYKVKYEKSKKIRLQDMLERSFSINEIKAEKKEKKESTKVSPPSSQKQKLTLDAHVAKEKEKKSPVEESALTKSIKAAHRKSLDRRSIRLDINTLMKVFSQQEMEAYRDGKMTQDEARLLLFEKRDVLRAKLAKIHPLLKRFSSSKLVEKYVQKPSNTVMAKEAEVRFVVKGNTGTDAFTVVEPKRTERFDVLQLPIESFLGPFHSEQWQENRTVQSVFVLKENPLTEVNLTLLEQEEKKLAEEKRKEYDEWEMVEEQVVSQPIVDETEEMIKDKIQLIDELLNMV